MIAPSLPPKTPSRPARAQSLLARLFLHFLYLLTLLYLLPLPSARAQNLDKPLVNVDDDVTAFAYAPDGRIAFSVRRMYKTKKYDLQRDDIFLLDTSGKRRRLFTGEKFTNGDKPFTYLVESFSWSPNGHILAVQLYTITANPEGGPADEARALLLLDDSGHELRPGGKEPLVMNAENPLWLRDNTTLVYFTEEVAPRTLFSMKYLNVTTGPAGKALEGRTFLAAKRIPGSNSAIAVERNRNLDGPARLQRLDLLSQETAEVATLDSYAGGLSLSPSGAKVAYYLDKEVLEVRDLAAPNKVARLRIGLGVLQWSADESRIYLKRTLEKKSADLAEFPIPPLVPYSCDNPTHRRAHPAHASPRPHYPRIWPLPGRPLPRHRPPRQAQPRSLPLLIPPFLLGAPGAGFAPGSWVPPLPSPLRTLCSLRSLRNLFSSSLRTPAYSTPPRPPISLFT